MSNSQATATTAVPNKTNLVCAEDSSLVNVVRACTRIAPSDATVLVTGETGTGKEVFAKLIHEKSQRASRPFVPVNCGAIPEALLESELFGHARGAFTGANTARKGRLAMAEGGTLFLDEIGELPLSLQVKLLRVLQERTYEPVGSNESVSANFRLVAATNRDLAAEVEAGRFRRDLYYRLMVCPVELPALRERKGDIAELFTHFWNERGETRPVEPAVLTQLQQYNWPGNVRELENLVERLSVCAEGSTIRVSDLPPALRGPEASSADVEITKVTKVSRHLAMVAPAEEVAEVASAEVSAVPASGSTADVSFASMMFPIDLPTLLRRVEEEYIDAAMNRSGGNKKAAADMLGLQRTTLVEKLRRRNRDVTGMTVSNS